jgi:hypothetical protein
LVFHLAPPLTFHANPSATAAAASGYASAVLVASDSQAAEAAARQLKGGSYGFLWCQLQELNGFHFER